MLLSPMAECRLGHTPDLLLVSPEDTDAVTYAYIQNTLAYARDDRFGGRAWRAKVPPEPPLPRKAGEPERAYYGRVIGQICSDGKGSSNREEQALVAARKRLARATKTKERAALR